MPSDHYFTERPSSSGARRALTATLRGFELRLVTEAGVFSRERVDPGTALLIRHMKVQPADRCLDLGCGYGVVGIIAAKLAAEGHVILVDINERAVALAGENLKANGITNAEALQGSGFAPVADRVFDVIALNPPIRAGLAVVHQLIEQAHAHLASGQSSPSPCTERGKGGEVPRLYLVGRTKQGGVRLAEKMRQVFGNAEEVAKGGGYRLYVSRRDS